MTPHEKQVMMFSATLSKESRPVCKKFMQDVMSCGLSHFSTASSYLSPSFLLVVICSYIDRRGGSLLSVGLLVAW